MFITSIAVDFDGVLHSFASGWTGPKNIPDPPVEGAISWLETLLRKENLQVIIFSARIFHWGGKRAMKKWLYRWGLTKWEISKIKFAYQKPACQFLLDDRVVCFRGTFPSMDEIENFKPWHGKGVW